MLKAAVAGCGRMGRIHANGYERNTRSHLVAVCDRDPDRMGPVAAHHGVPGYRSVAEMLEREQPQVVSVCTDAAHHLECVLAAVGAGAHVLCEKPMSGNVSDIGTMISAASKAGVLLGANFNHRFARVAELARQRIDAGDIGEICFANMWLTIALKAEVDTYFFLRSLHGHSFDMLRYLCGDIDRVYGELSKPFGRTYYSNCAVVMRFGNGAVGSLTGSYDMSNLHPLERVEIGGTLGRLVLDNVTAGLTFYSHDREVVESYVPVNYTRTERQSEYDFNITVEHRIEALLRAIEEGPADPAPGEDALMAAEIIEAVIRSFELGRVVTVGGD